MVLSRDPEIRAKEVKRVRTEIRICDHLRGQCEHVVVIRDGIHMRDQGRYILSMDLFPGVDLGLFQVGVGGLGIDELVHLYRQATLGYNGLPYDGRQIDAWSLGASIYTTLNGDVSSRHRTAMTVCSGFSWKKELFRQMKTRTLTAWTKRLKTRWSLEILLRSEWMNDPHSYTPSFPILPKWRA
ncbi:unnamed protein product, partial [Mesorhabditis spiculigera]